LGDKIDRIRCRNRIDEDHNGSRSYPNENDLFRHSLFGRFVGILDWGLADWQQEPSSGETPPQYATEYSAKENEPGEETVGM
jgi:hypothetical protein